MHARAYFLVIKSAVATDSLVRLRAQHVGTSLRAFYLGTIRSNSFCALTGSSVFRCW